MRLKIQLSYNNFKVPMSYQSIIQGVIYSLLSKDELGDFYHNDGYHYDKKIFKCFTFSQLFGKYKIENKYLIFDSDFYFYISSLDEEFLKHVYKTLLLNDSLLINKQQVKIKNISILNLQPFIGTKKICIETLSPMLIYSTKDNYSTYYRPSDKESLNFIINNIQDKCLAYHYPIKELVFKIDYIIYEKRRMMKFKNCFYECFMTKLEIETNFETLSLIYNCGLSSKNSCGFGMIDIAHEKSNISL